MRVVIPAVVMMLTLPLCAQTSQPAAPDGISPAAAKAYPAMVRRLAEDEARIKELTARVRELERLVPKPTQRPTTATASTLDIYRDYHQDFDPRALAVGQIGVVDWTRAKVSQVVDSSNLLVSIGEQKTAMLWVVGVDTAGMADDQAFKVKTPFRITGTKQYKTAGGSQKTVFVLEPFDYPAALEKIQRGEPLNEEEIPK